MTPSSAKTKGRRLQQWMASLILQYSQDLTEDDIVSRPMGSPGSDVMLSQAALEQWPFDVECKNLKRGFTKLYDALEQSNSRKRTALVVAKQNHKVPIVAMYALDFVEIIQELNELKALNATKKM